MITCNRCGKPTLAGMANCQNCGNPLTNTMSDGRASGNTPGMASPEQPELPAWLETLRSGGSTGASNFSAADLIDEGTLPSWMQPGREGNGDNTPSDAHPMRRPASAPAPDTDSTFLPKHGMAANSLIDEQSLPSWMQGQPEGTQSAGQESISAASLVQPGALPDWIRTIEPQSPGSPSTFANPVQYPQAPQAGPAPQPIAGHELIDQQALPQWMSGQNAAFPPSGQTGFAASSLLDAHALPTWLREENQDQRKQNVEAPRPAQAWQAPNYQPQVGQGQPQNMNNNLGAASLIDANALPDWLRSSEEQRPGMASYPQQQNPAEYPRQTTFGVQPRSDSMRVPSRPRAEMGYIEESEVAANTFASMLGVASATPNFPGQQPGDAFGRSQSPAQSQQNMPQSQMYGGGGMPPGSMQGQHAPGYPAGYQMGAMPGMTAQPPLAGNAPGMQSGAPMNNDRSNSQKKPAKRGFLSTILDWFSFPR